MRTSEQTTSTLLWLVFLLVLVLTPMSTALWAAPDAHETLVRNQCDFTRYPILCMEMLMPLKMGEGSLDDGIVVVALVNKTISEMKRHVFPSTNLARLVIGSSMSYARHAMAVSDHCEEMLTLSLRRLHQSLEALRTTPVKSKGDIQTWLSAVITLQESCKDSADSLRPMVLSRPSPMIETSKKMDYLSQLASNSLALVNRITNRVPNLVGEFPSWVMLRQRRLFQGGGGSSGVEANVVVAQDGTGDYTTVSDAIKVASSYGGRFVIYVKAGVYKEKIYCKRDALTLIGDGKYSTIIVGGDSVADGSTLLGSATFTITGDEFIARDIGFQNTAGPQGEQAVALTVASDRSVFYRCSFVGYQDTLYALVLRQFYRECDIYGTVDFIFGNAAAIFQNCYIVMRKPGDRTSYNVILANGRSDPEQNTGFVVQNCRIIPGTDFSPVKHSWTSYLGRPWKYYSRSVILESDMDDCISSRGWIEWPGYGSSTYKSLYFAEYGNRGPGAGTAKRVNWPGFHVIGADEAVKFTVGNFIAGTAWIPSTGVTFVSGLQ